ncbi:hypothetical protein J4416_02605 [Candidatus Pacearchaeota archaeon]|nr:hypothetical protein [Candidatus Pacearchaeota archaeon]
MEKDIDRIPKNQDTDIVIRVDDFGGRPGLTIREFVRSERYTGFTKAGTRIAAEHFNSFKDAINSIKESDFTSPSEGESQPQEQEKLETEKQETKKKAKETTKSENYEEMEM